MNHAVRDHPNHSLHHAGGRLRLCRRLAGPRSSDAGVLEIAAFHGIGPLSRRAQLTPDRVAVKTPERDVTFAGLEGLVAGACGSLDVSGVGPGDRVAVWGANDLATVTALWAIPRLGATSVLLNTRLAAPEVKSALKASGAVVALVGEDAPELGIPAIPLQGLADHAPIPPASRDPSDPWSIVFTSGTGGISRGVVLTRRNFLASARAASRRLGTDEGDTWLAVLPLFHIGGLSILWRSVLDGSGVWLGPGIEDVPLSDLLAEGTVTVASFVPTMLRRVLASHRGRFRGVRAVLVGGGPVDAGLVVEALDRGLPAIHTYGMTETTSLLSAPTPAEARSAVGTVGRPLPGVDLRVGDDGPASVGEGEIRVRGAVVATDYLDGPTRGEDGWLATGDVGTFDESGRLVVLGRSDDAVITGGEKVHPAEVEAVLESHPSIVAAGVYGEPDPEWGARVVAVLEPVASTAIDVGEIEAFLRARLAGFKIPRRWVESRLPRNALGKVDRDRLRQI